MKSIRIIVIASLTFLVVANLAFFTLSQNSFLGYNWVAIDIYNPNTININYEYRGFGYFFEYLSTFPGLMNTMETIKAVGSFLTGQFSPTDYNVVNAILGVLFMLWSPIQLIITLVTDIFNDAVWIIWFFVPKNWG